MYIMLYQCMRKLLKLCLGLFTLLLIHLTEHSAEKIDIVHIKYMINIFISFKQALI